MAAFKMNRPPDMGLVNSTIHNLAINRVVDTGDVRIVRDGDLLDTSESQAVRLHAATYQHGRKGVSRRNLERLSSIASLHMAKLDAVDYFGPPQTT